VINIVQFPVSLSTSLSGTLISSVLRGNAHIDRYPRANAQFRLALIFASASMAGAFSGLLAFGISKMDGVGGLEGWRWMSVPHCLLFAFMT